jgi:hypothetical protein
MLDDHRAGSFGWVDGWMYRWMDGGKTWLKALLSTFQKLNEIEIKSRMSFVGCLQDWCI